MSTKTASLVSSAITGALLILTILLLVFLDTIETNGVLFAENAPFTGGYICIGISVILSVILAWLLASFTITKFNWKGWLAILVSVLFTSVLGIISIIASLLVMIAGLIF